MTRDPKMNPIQGDILKKWDQCFLVNRCDQGMVFVMPSLSAHRDWIGLLFFREFAATADVVYQAPEVRPQEAHEASSNAEKSANEGRG